MTSTGEPRPRPANEELEPALSRPYLDLPADGPRNGALLMPRFTPRADAPAPAAPSPAVPSMATPPPPPQAGAAPTAPAGHAGRRARRPSWRPDPSVRAIIGDEIRIPIMWCQFGTCITRYTHPDALGEQDLRGRALAAGWRYDALGRLACPDCAQHNPAFWPTRAPRPITAYRRWAS